MDEDYTDVKGKPGEVGQKEKMCHCPSCGRDSVNASGTACSSQKCPNCAGVMVNK